MGRRLALLLVAIVIAALGTTLVFLYVKSADDRALEGQSPVRVLVATSQIAAGTTLRQAQSQGDLEERTIANSSAVEGAMSSIAAVADQVALATILPNQQLSYSMFGETAAVTSGLPLPSGNIAVSFQFTDPARVAGFVEPGSEIVVFVTIGQADRSGDGGGGNSEANEITRVLLPNALVVGVGPTTAAPQTEDAQTNEEQLPRALITLALTDKQAAKLVYGSQHGTLYLGLLNEKSKVSRTTEVTQENLFE